MRLEGWSVIAKDSRIKTPSSPSSFVDIESLARVMSLLAASLMAEHL